jgi:hypothetical protein
MQQRPQFSSESLSRNRDQNPKNELQPRFWDKLLA